MEHNKILPPEQKKRLGLQARRILDIITGSVEPVTRQTIDQNLPREVSPSNITRSIAKLLRIDGIVIEVIDPESGLKVFKLKTQEQPLRSDQVSPSKPEFAQYISGQSDPFSGLLLNPQQRRVIDCYRELSLKGPVDYHRWEKLLYGAEQPGQLAHDIYDLRKLLEGNRQHLNNHLPFINSLYGKYDQISEHINSRNPIVIKPDRIIFVTKRQHRVLLTCLILKAREDYFTYVKVSQELTGNPDRAHLISYVRKELLRKLDPNFVDIDSFFNFSRPPRLSIPTPEKKIPVPPITTDPTTYFDNIHTKDVIRITTDPKIRNQVGLTLIDLIISSYIVSRKNRDPLPMLNLSRSTLGILYTCLSSTDYPRLSEENIYNIKHFLIESLKEVWTHCLEIINGTLPLQNTLISAKDKATLERVSQFINQNGSLPRITDDFINHLSRCDEN